ncbi:CoA pyrophosphatase [Deinococcus sp. ZS9-10]|uniref:CoA pyrophosphatase n=1 Tax=Deinococcus arenicola TaxID=2994950 RepID=A0ABU4DVM1_9DEIO|nr:CoA pyrophosphatase [Deinococcus sp. ZS9-10]MDV6376485.1 CoA pyrophosphatase [Deinococcus sp. ZS9-10]
MLEDASAEADPWAAWLAARRRQPLHLPDYRPAAVLVALTREADPRVLLTVRSTELPTHQGQISFPGGSLEDGEGVVAAALREAWEEVGLDPAQADVLGELDDVFTPVGFHVTPVLARIPAQPTLRLSGEVAQILLPSLSGLRALTPSRETRHMPDGQPVVLYRYPWQGHDIWGMTARVLHDLLDSGPL